MMWNAAIILFMLSVAAFFLLSGLSIIIEALNALADKFGLNFWIDDTGLISIILICGKLSLWSALLLMFLKIIGG